MEDGPPGSQTVESAMASVMAGGFRKPREAALVFALAMM